MSQTKYKLPDDLKLQCLSLVKGYKRRVKLYHDRRNDIIYGGGSAPTGLPAGDCISDTTGNKALKLQKIEVLYDTVAMRAVEKAKFLIGLDCAEDERQKLMEAIWDSCIEGRNFIFNYRNLSVGKDNFYERRRKFLYDIAKYLESL